MTLRNYTNTSVATTLLVGIDAIQLSLTVADATGYPAAPFAIVVDPDVVASEEVLLVTAKAGPVFTVTRGYDGTTTKVHGAGATVIHAAIAADFVDAQEAARFTYATGTLTIAVQPTVGDTITIGSLTFSYVAGFANPGEITIGATLADTQASTVSVVNQGIGVPPDAGAVAFVANVSTISPGEPGAVGNGIATTSVFTDAGNFFSQAALSGGADGSTSGHIQAQTTKMTGASPDAPLLILQTAAGQDEFAASNIFEIVEADGTELMKVDAGGNFYTKRDLRMVDASNAANFTVEINGKMYSRIPDIDDAARWQVRGTIPGVNDVLVFALRPRATVAALVASQGAGAVALEIDTNGLDDDTDLIKAYGTSNFDVVFRLLDRGAVVVAQHTAPDDNLLSAGDMALWFDQTNGAAQMMIKAKTADGTVVTGAVALI